MRNTSSVVISPGQGPLFQKAFLYISALSLALLPPFKIPHKEHFLNGNEVFAIEPFPVSSNPLEAVSLAPSKVNGALQSRRNSGIAVITHNLLVAVTGHLIIPQR